MDWLTNPEIWIGLITLTVLEVVLGIDNIIFISILAGKLPEGQQARARQVGLLLAMGMRILLLVSLAWIVGLTQPLFTILGWEVTGRDIIMLGGGVFLMAKATREIHDKLEGEEGHASAKVPPSFSGVIVQIILLDIVFSLDSVITAVGMVREVGVMIAAVIIAVLIMLVAAVPISLAGWGPREGAAAWVFAMTGAQASEGLAVSVAYGAMVLVGALPGLLVIRAHRSQRSVVSVRA